jgi:predicted regulator of Ras-like GTPase activity (Roadblock/LC7/MglB family)
MSTGLHLKPEVVQTATALLGDMKAAASSLMYAALLTDDGFDVARFPVESNGERFAGMASSMQALGDAVAHELKIGESEYIIIASGTGHVVQLRVPAHELVLSALFDNDATVGHALAITRSFAQKTADLLG